MTNGKGDVRIDAVLEKRGDSMGKTEQDEKERAMLEHIKRAIELYNEISRDKVELVPQTKKQEKQEKTTPFLQGSFIDRNDIAYDRKKITPTLHIPTGRKNPKMEVEEKCDVGSCYIGFYDQRVGLFIQVNWVEPDCDNFITVYQGVDNENVGIWQSVNSVFGSKQRWLKEGEKATFCRYKEKRGEYTATCNMQDVILFEDMRAIMRKEGKISNYALARASKEEIEEVLAYAQDFFCSKLESRKNKTFTKFSRR